VFIATSASWPNGPRIDDLALTLYYADTEFGLATSQDRIAALPPLVRAYASGLDNPLTDAEREVLPWAIARQPLWGIGGRVVVLYLSRWLAWPAGPCRSGCRGRCRRPSLARPHRRRCSRW
jgi:hypothetical protein